MIYFLQRADGAIKIGVTDNFQARLSNLMYEYGDLDLLGLMDGSFSEEKALHFQFMDKNLSGEWFQDCDEIRAYVSQNATLVLPKTSMKSIRLSESSWAILSLLGEVMDKSLSDTIITVVKEKYPDIMDEHLRRQQQAERLRRKVEAGAGSNIE